MSRNIVSFLTKHNICTMRRKGRSSTNHRGRPQPREGKDRLEDCQGNQGNLEHLTSQATTASSVTKAEEVVVEKIETDSSHQNKWAHSRRSRPPATNQLKLPKSKDSTKNIAQ